MLISPFTRRTVTLAERGWRADTQAALVIPQHCVPIYLATEARLIPVLLRFERDL